VFNKISCAFLSFSTINRTATKPYFINLIIFITHCVTIISCCIHPKTKKILGYIPKISQFIILSWHYPISKTVGIYNTLSASSTSSRELQYNSSTYINQLSSKKIRI